MAKDVAIVSSRPRSFLFGVDVAVGDTPVAFVVLNAHDSGKAPPSGSSPRPPPPQGGAIFLLLHIPFAQIVDDDERGGGCSRTSFVGSHSSSPSPTRLPKRRRSRSMCRLATSPPFCFRADGPQPDQHGHRLARAGLGHRGAQLPLLRQHGSPSAIPGGRQDQDPRGHRRRRQGRQGDRLRRQDLPRPDGPGRRGAATARTASTRAAASTSATAPTCSSSRTPTATTRPTSDIRC